MLTRDFIENSPPGTRVLVFMKGVQDFFSKETCVVWTENSPCGFYVVPYKSSTALKEDFVSGELVILEATDKVAADIDTHEYAKDARVWRKVN